MVYFKKFLTPFTSGGCNFLNSILCLAIFSVLNAPIGGVQVFLNIRNNRALPLDLACPKCLSVWSMVGLSYNCNSIASKEQLKKLFHMICLQIPCYKLYKEDLFSYILTLKYMCHFGMSSKSLTQ